MTPNSVVLIPNTQRPDWPVAPKPARPKDDADAARFEKENGVYLKQVSDLQKAVPWPHCHGAENLSFRAAVQEWVAELNLETLMPEGKLERTICWVGDACPRLAEVQSVTIEPRIRYQEWREDCLGRSRYVFLSFKVTT